MFYLRTFAPFLFISLLLDVLVPRFLKEEVAFGLVGGTEDPEVDEYYPICSLKDATYDDNVVMVGTLKSFNLFGFGLFPRLVGELRPYEPEENIEG